MNKIINYFLICLGLAISFESIAADGPTAIGNISIGMSKADYISAIGTTPIDCNKLKDKDGQVLMVEPKSLSPDKKYLCHDFRIEKKTGIIETVKINEFSYDVIQADYGTSKLINSIGHGSKAYFIKDTLIGLEIYSPKVTLDVLSSKYGLPKLIDKTKTDTCQNRIGNQFKYQSGTIDAVWTNGGISATYRTIKQPPRDTCTDNYEMQYYIIENRKEVEQIELAIKNLTNELAKKSAKESPF